MSIATEITRLNGNLDSLSDAKTAIASAITTKGGTVASSDGFADFATDIASIPSGGDRPSKGIAVSDFVDGYPMTVEFIGYSDIPESFMRPNNNVEFILSRAINYILNEGIKNIGVSAFRDLIGWDNKDLRTLIIPSSVETIADNAFASLRVDGGGGIIFKGTPLAISSSAFASNREFDIYVPWAENAVANAPWGATSATIHYNYTPEV